MPRFVYVHKDMPNDPRVFRHRVQRLDRMPDLWTCTEYPDDDQPDPGERRPAPAWADLNGPGSRPPELTEPAEGAQRSGLVVIRSGRRRRGAPPDTISGTPLDAPPGVTHVPD